MTDRIKYPDDWSETDKLALDSLFIEARAKNLWFFHQGLSGLLWFSPDELKKEQENGKFVWGAINWQLRDPHEHLTELVNKVADAEKAYKDLKKRLV